MQQFKKYFLLIWLAVFLSACKENIFLSRKYFYGKLKTHSDIERFVPVEVNAAKVKPSLKLPITCSVMDINVVTIKQIPDIKNSYHRKKKNIFFKNKSHEIKPHKHKGALSGLKMEFKLKKMNDKNVCLKSGLVVILYWVILFSLRSNLMAFEVTSLLMSLQIVGIVILAAVFFMLIKYLFKVLYQKTRESN